MSDQERPDEPNESEEEMQDLDVPEEQTDDVTGGKKRWGTERGTRGMK